MSTQPSHIFCVLDLIIDHIILHRKEEFDKAFIAMLVFFVLASGCIAFSTILFYDALTTLLTKLYNNLTAMLQLFRLLTTNEEKAIVEADQATMNRENQSTEDAGEGEQIKGCLICAHVAKTNGDRKCVSSPLVLKRLKNWWIRCRGMLRSCKEGALRSRSPRLMGWACKEVESLGFPDCWLVWLGSGSRALAQHKQSSL